MPNLENIIKISQENYNILISGGSITKEDIEYTYDENAIYLVENDIFDRVEILDTSLYNEKIAREQADTSLQEELITKQDKLFEKGVGEYSIQTIDTSCIASGNYSIAEGESTHATGEGAHAEGAGTVASGKQSHAEGASSTATGDRAHAEGIESYASGVGSHAEGDHTLVSTRAEVAHTEGDHTVADNIAEHAEGRYNRSNHNDESVGFGDAGNTLHSIGIGTGSDINLRMNAVEVMQNGDVYINGIGDYNGKNFADAQTVQEVCNAKQDILTAGNGIDITENVISTKIITNELDSTNTIDGSKESLYKEITSDLTLTYSTPLDTTSFKTVSLVIKNTDVDVHNITLPTNIHRMFESLQVPAGKIAEIISSYSNVFGWVVNGGVEI